MFMLKHARFIVTNFNKLLVYLVTKAAEYDEKCCNDCKENTLRPLRLYHFLWLF